MSDNQEYPQMTYEQLKQSHSKWRMLAMHNYTACAAEKVRADQAEQHSVGLCKQILETEGREQKLKEAIETSMELGMLEYASYAYEHFEETLSTLYPKEATE